MTAFDEHGNPVPTPDDTCEKCGRRRDTVDELYMQIVTPYDSAEYLCEHCR